MQFLTLIPQWLVTVGLVVTGALAVLGIVSQQTSSKSKNQQEEADSLAQKVRNLYKEESDAQNEKIKVQAGQLTSLSERLASLEGENKTFRSILTGTDDQSKSYRARVEASLTLVDKLAEVIMENGKKTNAMMEEVTIIMEAIKGINTNIEKLVIAMNKQNRN